MAGCLVMVLRSATNDRILSRRIDSAVRGSSPAGAVTLRSVPMSAETPAGCSSLARKKFQLYWFNVEAD
jgi:hypothetical protein